MIVLVQQWRMDDSQTQTHIVWRRVSCLVIHESYIIGMDKLPMYLLSDCLFFMSLFLARNEFLKGNLVNLSFL